MLCVIYENESLSKPVKRLPGAELDSFTPSGQLQACGCLSFKFPNLGIYFLYKDALRVNRLISSPKAVRVCEADSD